MDWQIQQLPPLIPEGEKIDNPNIRFVRIQRGGAFFPVADTPLERPWSTFQNGNPIYCSAVGFYFVQQLQKELNIPIGLIDAAVRGTPIDYWMPPDAWNDHPNLDNRLRGYKDNLSKIKGQVGDYLEYLNGHTSSWQAVPQKAALDQMGNLFNTMIFPVAPYGIRGMIWYQGESNVNDGALYYNKQRGMIESWRRLWNQGDFPFYFVQIASFTPPNDNPMSEGIDWAKLRDAQTKTLEVKNTGMAVTIDIGDADDIHPVNKFDVGRRLALLALAKDYGRKELVYSGPIYREMKIEGNQIRLWFDYAEEGLIIGKKEGREPTKEVPGGTLKRFALAGEDQQWVWAEAEIDGKTVVVSSPKIEKPVAVRYAWSTNPAGCNLYNKSGLPASPFRTDSW
jgi:sialate O-acetylesterase